MTWDRPRPRCAVVGLLADVVWLAELVVWTVYVKVCR